MSVEQIPFPEKRDKFSGPPGTCGICKNPLKDHDLVDAYNCAKKRIAMDKKNTNARARRKSQK